MSDGSKTALFFLNNCLADLLKPCVADQKVNIDNSNNTLTNFARRKTAIRSIPGKALHVL